jgi:hypothetical protein
VWDKKKNEITLVEVAITSLDQLNIVENEKRRKYDLLAGELSLLYKRRTKPGHRLPQDNQNYCQHMSYHS